MIKHAPKMLTCDEDELGETIEMMIMAPKMEKYFLYFGLRD
jgi:hypothetical protein